MGSTLYTLAGVGGIGATGAFFVHDFAGVFLTEWSEEEEELWDKYEDLDEE